MTTHPDLAEEQAYVDHAYACLERSRADAWRLRDMTEVGRGGTHQARYEAEVFEGAISQRLTRLELGDAALVFGRIDRYGEGGVESFHIGRLAVADQDSDPVVVDWRAPVAEPFYRATGRHPMGLARRRHFAVKGPVILGLEDELFGEGHLGVGPEAPEGLRGYSTLLAALERGRTGTLGDIVATIQAEQDEIIRSPQAGVLVVQGGPGTGKTVVALHRAAYLLYTHRFPLEDQGVLVIGPNRLFLRYIEQVLPSLGEAGVEQVVLADLVPDGTFGARDTHEAARVKGDAIMAEVLTKAVRDRERALKQDLVVPFGLGHLRLRIEDSERIVREARRRYRRHNGARRFVEGEVFAALAASARDGNATTEQVRDRLRGTDDVRAALERMWPQLSPAELLNDLFGSRSLLRLAAGRLLAEEEYAALHRERAHDAHDQVWSEADAPLLDEARALLGPKPVKGQRSANKNPDGTPAPVDDEIRTYGHIVIDEVQDLSPMALRMAARRSLNGSMTVVGDLVQATGEHAPTSWDDVLAHLPDRRAPRVVGLSVGYRIPETIMALADKVAEQALPGLRSPRSVRAGENPPAIIAAEPGALGAAVAEQVRRLQQDLGEGVVAVITPDSLADEMLTTLAAFGIEAGQASRHGLEQPVTVVPVGLVKGLELDGVVVVEPAQIVAEMAQGLRALYVALTRATRELAVVHTRPLPF